MKWSILGLAASNLGGWLTHPTPWNGAACLVCGLVFVGLAVVDRLDGGEDDLDEDLGAEV